jgi:hypothetical protein
MYPRPKADFWPPIPSPEPRGGLAKIKVISLSDLPVPPEKAQLALELEPPADSASGSTLK